jgi:hypothetical protein
VKDVDILPITDACAIQSLGVVAVA